MATLSVSQITTAGIADPSLTTAAGGGDQFSNNGKTYLKVANATGATVTVTIASQQACSQGATHNTTASVASGQTKLLGPFPADRYNDANGYVQVSYSGVTSITVGAVAL